MKVSTILIIATVQVLIATHSSVKFKTRSPPNSILSQGTTLLGVYRSSAPTSPNNFGEYENWLNGAQVRYGLGFEAIDNWQAVEGGSWLLDPFSKWVNAKSAGERTFVISIGMLPKGGNNSVTEGAKGTYDSYFVNLGNNLIKYNLTSSVLRIGWEFNGNWQPWKASANTTAWTIFFQRIVNALRSTYSGFKIMWNPNAGYAESDASLLYPGDSYVDYIAIDTYDTSYDSNLRSYSLSGTKRGWWLSSLTYQVGDIVDYDGGMWRALVNLTAGDSSPIEGSKWHLEVNSTRLQTERVKSWNDIHTGYRGLTYWTQYAANHSKPLVIQEWGAWLIPNGGRRGQSLLH